MVILYLTHAWRAHAAAAGMMPTTVRMEMVGTIVSVMAGGPSKKTSSGTSAAAGFAAAAFVASPPLRLPRLA